jgi:hypothetical protein
MRHVVRCVVQQPLLLAVSAAAAGGLHNIHTMMLSCVFLASNAQPQLHS